jgi:hypothetical protein
MLERNAMHRQRKTCRGTERTENKVAEEDQNGNEKGVERIGHVRALHAIKGKGKMCLVGRPKPYN